MTVKIVTDSSNTMERALAEELGITIVPLTTMVDGVVYSDGDLKEGQFLELMRSSKALPKTSQPRSDSLPKSSLNWPAMAARLLLFTCLMPFQELWRRPGKVQPYLGQM